MKSSSHHPSVDVTINVNQRYQLGRDSCCTTRFPTSTTPDSSIGSSAFSIINHLSPTCHLNTLGRTKVSTTEAPSSPATVQLFQSSSCSRPGPVCGLGEGVFQTASQGKYDRVMISSFPDSSVDSSASPPQEIRQQAGLTENRKIWMYYQNVRGIRTKIDDLFLAAADCEFDVIILVETGLDDSIDSMQIFGPGYNVFRCDRNVQNSDKTCFGGVLIAVALRYASSLVTVGHGTRLEQVCVSMDLHGYKLYLCAVYIPPDRSRDVEVMENHMASVKELSDNAACDDKILVCGDYNQPRLQWMLDDNKVYLDETSSLTAASIALVDGMDFVNLCQRNTVRNELNRTLDLVFCNDENDLYIDESAVPLLPIDAHHPPLILSLPAPLDCPSHLTRNVEGEPGILDYSKIDYALLMQYLLDQDWTSINECSDVDVMTVRFCSIIQHWLESNVPLKRRSVSPAWSTPQLRMLKRDRNAAQRKLRRHRTADTKRDFKRASTAYSKLNGALYKSHVLRVQWNLRRNPRSFWSFVNSKRKNSSIPSNMLLDGKESTSPNEVCDMFAKYFASVFDINMTSDAEAESAASDTPMDFVEMSTFEVTRDMVLSAARRLKSSLSPGPDGIPAVVFCRCSAALAEPLAAIFNASFEQGKFPITWKQSYMFPVFKSGNKRDVRNYRGITSLSAASKLFEIILSEYVLNRSKSYISADQHGFIPGRSVATNLLDFTSTCITAMEEKAQIDVVYTDLKAAFDKIDHKVLLCKLSRLGASVQLKSWLHSYLTERTLRVRIGSCVSSAFSSTSGVPQGSNLGPLLFTLFFNDVAALLGVKCKLIYADDLKLYVIVHSIEDCHRLQALLNLFVDWCRRNKLIISVPKCAVMTFHRSKNPILFDYCIDNVTLRRVDRVSDLGVLLDQKLNFNLHYSSIISKANRQLGFISKIARDFKDPHCLKSLYCSLVRPILENASVVWCPYELVWILRIERVQKRFLRLALRSLPWRDPINLPPYPDRCMLLNLDTLEHRRKMQQSVFIAKLINGDVDCPQLLAQLNFRVPQRMLRQSSLLQPRFHRTAYGYYEPMSAMIREFTAVESAFEFGETSNQFRNRLRRM